MPPHKILKECQEEFKEINEKLDDVNAQIFDIRDNDLKHQGEDIAFLKGRLSLLVWAIPLSFAVIGGIIALIDRLWS